VDRADVSIRSGRSNSTGCSTMAPFPADLPSRIVSAEGPAATLLVRLLVGGVFLSEGIQKFLYPDALGVGRFARIGIPAPALMAPFVACVEIACGLLLVVGLLTRLAAIPLIVDMLVAIVTTKVPMLIEAGFWAMAHEARTDYSMLLGCVFLLRVGSGRLSLDARIGGSKRRHA
jgi:putative oxidoreductase